MQKLITRKEWGARYADGTRYVRPLPFTEFWLHHSVTIAPDLIPPFTDDDAAVRTLEDIGQSRFGCGISYTFPVTPVGRIYQGHSINKTGSHTLGHNTVGAAFCLVGDYSKTPPTAEQEEAIAQRMVIEHRAGRSSTHQLNGGHCDVYGTSCPGNAAYARIPAINARADALWAAGYPANDVSQEDTLMSEYTPDDLARAAGIGVHGQRIGRSQVTFGIAAERLLVQVDALTAAVQALSIPGVDTDRVIEAVHGAVNDAIDDRVKDADISLTIDQKESK